MGNALAGRGASFFARLVMRFSLARLASDLDLFAALLGGQGGFGGGGADELRRVFEPESGGDVAEMKSLDVEYV